MEYPAWVTNPEFNEQEHASALLEYHFRRAAMWHNREASIPLLAQDMGVTSSAFYEAIKRGSCTPAMAVTLELLVGCNIVTREMLCPEKYA